MSESWNPKTKLLCHSSCIVTSFGGVVSHGTPCGFTGTISPFLGGGVFSFKCTREQQCRAFETFGVGYSTSLRLLSGRAACLFVLNR